MKFLTKSMLGSAIAALLATPAFAAGSDTVVQPPLLPAKAAAVELEQPTNRLIVKFRDGAMTKSMRESALARVATSYDIQAKSTRRMAVGADVVELSRKLDRVEVDAFLQALRADPTVEYAVVDRIMRPLYTPNDPEYLPNQWHYHNVDGGARLPTAWNRGKGAGAVVAVIDTGITDHSDLDANVLPGYDFISFLDVANDLDLRDADPSDPGDWVAANECGAGSGASDSSWHGTHVAGTVAAVTNNKKGVAGSAPLAKVVPVRVLGKCGGYTSDIADGIVWASGGSVLGVPDNANPAEVINMSLGGAHACDAPTQAAIDGAVARGTVVVVAAGNSNSSVGYHSPANCNNVITVASNDIDGGRSYFSNAGDGIDISAGGGSPGVRSTGNAGTQAPAGETYLYMQGTSMAAPHIAGVVALMQAHAANTPADVESILKATARKMDGADCPGLCGAGIVHAARAMDVAAGGAVVPVSTVINNDIAVPVSGSMGTVRRFVLSVFPDLSNLQFNLGGGSGDADLYVKLGGPPSATDYDCRSSTAATDTEVCNLPASSSAAWHVMVKGKSTFTTNLTGSYDSRFFTNRTDVAILDADPAFTSSSVLVHGRAGNAPSNLLVSVRIHHTYVGDLTLNLVAPDGTVYPLQDEVGGSGDLIEADFFVDASTEVANGTWQLQVSDGYNLDTGHIDQWVMRF